MQADLSQRRIIGTCLAILLAASGVVVFPAAPKAEAQGPSWLGCNLPGGAWACDKVADGSKWLFENSGAEYAAEGLDEAADFASDPLGYLEQKVRLGAQGLFSAFGEELTGKKPKFPEPRKRFRPVEKNKTFKPRIEEKKTFKPRIDKNDEG